jgi:DNA mismatch repair ATPase MutS
MDTIARKLESLLSYINPNNSEKGANVIDLQKTFSSINIDLLPIVVKILELEAGFPTSKIITSEGNKYHELEFFTTNQDSSNSTENKSLFERLDKTQTLLGSNILKSIILKPYHSFFMNDFITV